MSKSVLIINESDKYRNQLAQAIEKAGHTVIACGNGKDGVSIFLKEHPAVVILDISISVMNGIDFLKKVEIRPGASFIVIILTDFQNEENIRFCSNLGGRNYLRKDHHPKELLTMINLAGEATESKNRISLAEQEVLTKQKELIETQKGFSRVGKILENGHFFYAYKTDHGFIDVGSTVENVLGYTESEFQNDYLTYLTGNEINAQYEQFRASALKGKEQVYELEFIHRNGLKKTLRFYDYPTKDASDGNFVVEGFAADITDQVKIKRDMNILNKKLEEIYDKHGLELSKVKIKYDELLKTVNDWVCETDENSLIISSNSAGSSILGYHEKELAGKSLLEFLHETDKKILNSELKNAVDNSDVTRLDVNFITKSGELKPMMMSILTNGHNGDSRSAFKFIVHDQTHEHLSKKLSAQNHLLFSEFKDAAFTFDSNGIIESYHSSQPQTLGISGDKLIGTEIWNLPFLKNHYNLTHDVLDQVLRDQEKFTTKINTTARGENHVFHTVLAPYLDAKILMTLEEVTDWENLESELNLQKSIGSILLESVANMASYLIDKEGTIREVSKIALQNTGAGLDELLGGNLYGFIDKKDVANLKKLVADACESGEKKMFESEKDEQIISYSVIPVLENEKYLSSLVVTVDDSTQISQALRNYDWEKSVRETALAKLAEAILFVDPIGQVKFVSESLSRLTGFECQSLVGTEAPFPFWGKIHRKELHSEFKDVVLSAHPEDRISKCVLTTVEGEEIKATQTYSRILDGAGKYLGTLILIKDRMETTRLESSLEEIMEQVKFLTGSFTDPVFRLSGTGKILNISASFQHLTGYEPKDIEGKPLMDFLSSGDRTTYLKILKELFLNKKLLSFRINLKKKDGGFIPVLINVMMIRNNGKTTASGTIRDISEQIDLEHKLTSYTCAMENLESHVPLGVIHLDMQSKIEMANAEFCRLLGLEMSSVSGKSITELIKTKPSGKWYQSGSSPTQVFVQDWQKQDGKIVKTEVTLFDMASDSSPNQKGRLAVIRDLTDEELLKSELNSTRNRNNILFNHSRDGIFLLDGQTIKECNAAALDLFNAPQNKVIGRTLSKFSINEGKNGTGKPTLLTHKIEKAFGGENLDFEWKFIGSGGSERICEVKLNRVEMDGKFYLNCIIRDQSELVELKEDVHNYREKMGKIIETESSDLQNEIHQLRKHTKRYETGPLSILDWDYRLGDGIKIVYASESLRQYGLTPEGLISGEEDLFDSIVAMEKKDTCTRVLENIQQDRKSWDLEFKIKSTDAGERWIYDLSQKMGSKSKDGTIHYRSYLMDVTELNQNQQNIKNEQADLVHAGKLAALDEMGTGIAHEINQPLAIIRAQADVLKLMAGHGFEDPAELERDINEIIKQTERASDIIEKLRQYARGSKQDIQEMDVTVPVVSGIQFFIEKASADNIELEKSFAANLPTVKIDKAGFEQVVVNLISNAIYAVNRKNETADLEYAKKISLSLSLNTQKKAVEFRITDNGMGMTPDQKDKCLEPFYTGKPVGEGTGLGLTLVYSIVKGFSGTMELESSHNEGTTVRIYIPV